MSNEEHTFRPKSFDKFIGQKETVEQLKIMLDSASKRNTVIEHVLLSGPPGLGKTTLSNIIAENQNGKLFTIAAPSIEKTGDIASIFAELQEGDVLFIDEIHRLSSIIEEFIYPAMEDFRLDVLIDADLGKKAISIPLPKFTLVAATTKAGSLTAPLKARFGSINTLELYNEEDLTKIILNNQEVLGSKITQESAEKIASVSRGTPRIANNLSKWCRDFAIHKNTDINIACVNNALKKKNIDIYGLEKTDRKILEALTHRFKGRAVGIKSLATAINVDPITIEENHEPLLIQKGYMERTPSGRMITELGRSLIPKKKGNLI